MSSATDAPVELSADQWRRLTERAQPIEPATKADGLIAELRRLLAPA